MLKARVGFLYNHYATHQVLHTAPVAFALSELDPDLEVQVLASCETQLAMARRIGAGWPDHRVAFRQLPLSRADQALRRFGIEARNGLKRRTLLANRDLLAELDALVVPERTSVLLRKHPTLNHVQLIHIPHGAGDRAVGYERRNAAFDLLLVSGEKCRQRFISEVGIDPDRVHAIGYPKFDVPVMTPAVDLFPEARPTVLYNPHFDPKLSSWPRLGQRVLEFFSGQSTFNLIFAPHVMLPMKRGQRMARSLARFGAQPHIHIDLGSDRCVDMTYTRCADIYLGDVSSQIYEFVVNPRPAVFFNAHRLRGWEQNQNFRHWTLGTVIEDVAELNSALLRPLTAEMRERQQRLASMTFRSSTRSASGLAAELIRTQLMKPHPQRACRQRPMDAALAESRSRRMLRPAIRKWAPAQK